jgi:pimeloyl-ACP methyl ester carboxylesterase
MAVEDARRRVSGPIGHMGGAHMPPRETTHTVRNVRVRLFAAGDGPPLVFLHGAAGIERWLPFFDLLAARYTVLAPEHPGFGASDNPSFISDVSDAAMYYLDFFDGLADGLLRGSGAKIHLIGNSLGGWIAAELATRNCTHLKSLTLLAPAGVRVKGVLSGDDFIWSPDETARNLVYDQALADTAIAVRAAMTAEEAERALVNRYAAAKFGWEPRWFNPALERWLHRISVPTLVLWGEDDKLLPAQYAEVWRREVPGAAVEIIPACGHLPHVEHAGTVAKRVLEFIGAS